MAAAGTDGVGGVRICGIPAANWAYATRIWVAMLVALYAGFWLQLDGAGEAAVTVTILSQPMRGQVLSKSFYRALGTFVGFLACIAITGFFAQTRDLYVLAYSLWIGACVYAGSLSEGTRAYAFVLSGYTVAIVVVANTDHPSVVFDAAASRLAVVLLGIAAITLVNDVLAAPDVYPKVRDRLRKAIGETRGVTRDMLSGGVEQDREMAAIDQVSGARLDILALPEERAAGACRSAAARNVVAALTAALAEARMSMRVALSGASDGSHPTWDGRIQGDLRTDAEASLRVASAEFENMEAGRRPDHTMHLPHHRSHEEALRKAARVLFAVAASSIVLIYGDWPDAVQALTQVIVLGCLGMTVPDDKEFAKVCLIAMPLAAAVGGLTKFLLLYGGNGFPMLALGIAPGVFLCCLLFCNAKTSEIGLLTLIYVAVFIEPANPQRYDPQKFIQLALLYNVGVILLAIALTVFIPITGRDRRRWLLRGFERDLHAALSGQGARTAAELSYLGSDRMARLAKVDLGSPQARTRRLARAALLSDVAFIAARTHASLADPTLTAGPSEIAAARRALETFSAHGLHESAGTFDGISTTRADGRAATGLRCLAGLAAAPPPCLRRAIGGIRAKAAEDRVS